LLRGFDHRPPQAFQGLISRLGHSPRRDEWHYAGHAEFDRFLDQPPLAIAFGQSHAQDQFARQFAIRFAACQHR
jgi:hypothetical protein